VRATLAIALVPFLLTSCGGSERPADQEPPPEAATSSPAGSVAGEDAEEVFLRVTAQHACDVQGQVYEDPEALAKAYDSLPDYPGLDEAQVERLQARLENDADLSGALNEQVARICG